MKLNSNSGFRIDSAVPAWLYWHMKPLFWKLLCATIPLLLGWPAPCFGESLYSWDGSHTNHIYKAHGKLLDAVNGIIWITRQTEVDGKPVQIDLVYFHEKDAKSSEIRLFLKMDGQTNVIWSADIGSHVPSEFLCEISNNKKCVGLGFEANPNTFLFFEIDLGKALKITRGGLNHVPPSDWARAYPITNTNDLRQEVYDIWLLPDKLRHVPFYVQNLKLNNEGEKWIFSFDVKGVTPETRYYYQYPVGGVGLTFLKKEPVPQIPESTKICRQNLFLIDQGKIIWSLKNDKKPGDIVDTNALFNEILKHSKIICPDGGIYDVGALGEPPKCSIHGVYENK